jgi:hypothetical protein
MRFCAARLPPGTRSAFHAVVLGQARDQPRGLINETLRRAICFQRTQNLTLAHVPANFSFSLSLRSARVLQRRGSCDADKGRAAREGKSLAGECMYMYTRRWMDVCTRKSCAAYFICHSAVRLGLRDIAR